MIRDEEYKIELDLDRDRIKTILSEAYNIAKEYLNTEFEMSRDQFVAQIDPYLDSNRVSITVQVNLPCRKYPGMKIEVDLRKRKVMARMFPSRTQAMLNHLLKTL